MSKIHLKGHISPDGEIELKTPKIGVKGLVIGGIASLMSAAIFSIGSAAGSYAFQKWMEYLNNKERSQQ